MESLAGTKVLFVITKSNWGGAQAYTYALAKAVRDAGGDSVVALGGTGAAGAGSGLLAEKLEADGIRTIFLSAFMRDISIFKEFSAFFSLVKVFRDEQPDVVHLNSSKAGGLGALAARFARVPLIVFTAHGWAHREPRPAPIRLLIRLVSWITIALCHRVIVVSALDLRDAPARFFRGKLVLVQNGMAAFPLLQRKEARGALASLAEENSTAPRLDARWILAVSELHPNKGIDVLIQAFSALLDTEAELVVLGSGQELANLQKAAAETGATKRIHLLGFVPEARKYLKAADVYALPSRKEGLPLALLEAGLAQVPVAASRVGGVPEVVMNTVTGLLVEPDDADALCAVLDALLEDSKLRETLADNLHHRVLADFSEKDMVRKTFDAYATNS